jgi:hypothetical protein
VLQSVPPRLAPYLQCTGWAGDVVAGEYAGSCTLCVIGEVVCGCMGGSVFRWCSSVVCVRKGGLLLL